VFHRRSGTDRVSEAWRGPTDRAGRQDRSGQWIRARVRTPGRRHAGRRTGVATTALTSRARRVRPGASAEIRCTRAGARACSGDGDCAQAGRSARAAQAACAATNRGS
jgi:hypothetical protein